MRRFKTNLRMPKQVGWLIPGLQVKRWFALIFIGATLMVLSFLILLDVKPIFNMINFIQDLAKSISSEWIAFAVLMFGAGLFFKGWTKTNLSIIDGKDNQVLLEALYRKRKLNRGPKVVAVGGGTGLSMLLKGVKRLTNNVTAVVTVGDDGGSSGRLRNQMGVLPPGDIRNCIAALADDEDLVTELFQYRFNSGDGLEGHSFGNLFLTALCSITGDMVRAVKESSNVLSIRGRVLPSTLDDMKLVAELEDGRIINGESNIPEAQGKIKRLSTNPRNCKALDDVIEAIKDAELIILGPGSLYTSVIPNLLIKEIAEEIANSSAKKIYVCNIMTQPGETDNYSVYDHVSALIEHAGSSKIIDAILINDFLPENLAKKYEMQNAYPVKLDLEKIKKLGLKIVSKKLIQDSKEGLVRHSSNRVARAIYYWYRKENKLEKISYSTIKKREKEMSKLK
ncbi:MAG: gluconeogenesis factor YvcK family protein [Candidatus Gastranaerophilales bacterium]